MRPLVNRLLSVVKIPDATQNVLQSLETQEILRISIKVLLSNFGLKRQRFVGFDHYLHVAHWEGGGKQNPVLEVSVGGFHIEHVAGESISIVVCGQIDIAPLERYSADFLHIRPAPMHDHYCQVREIPGHVINWQWMSGRNIGAYQPAHRSHHRYFV